MRQLALREAGWKPPAGFAIRRPVEKITTLLGGFITDEAHLHAYGNVSEANAKLGVNIG